MLVLMRKPGQQLMIGDIVVTLLAIRGNSVRVGVEADRSINVRRGELAPLNKPQRPEAA
jgi:carbon storage regulator